MSELVTVFFTFLFLAYLAACGLSVPAYLMEQSSARSECAEIHNVYTCEKFEEWRPVITENK